MIDDNMWNDIYSTFIVRVRKVYVIEEIVYCIDKHA